MSSTNTSSSGPYDSLPVQRAVGRRPAATRRTPAGPGRRARRPAARCSAASSRTSPGYQLLVHLVVVPLVDLRHLGGERSQVLVEQVVGVLPAVLGRASRRPCSSPGSPGCARSARRAASPTRPSGPSAYTVSPLHRKKSGRRRPHRPEDAHPAEVRVDPPALPGDVAGPDEPDVAPSCRPGAVVSDTGQRLTEQPGPVQALHPDPVVAAVRRPAGRAAGPCR